ncbi:MAG: hypothetical protein LBJ20_03790 [Candidatus Methanoplasma sp.]|jgi:GTPase SAR1 family protein|nr:hypothetical protein [Candidatus Methanoplasma sp.]
MAKKTESQTSQAIYTCPFCFSSVDLKNIHHQCTNPACTKIFLRELDDKKGHKYRSKNIEEEIDIENSIFLGKDPAGPSPVTTKYHIIRDPSGICDICRKPVYKRLCPSCHNPIPQGAEEEGSTVFVVLGPKGVGKSHYIAVLINQLRNSFSPEFGATMSPATDRTTLKYRDMYYKRLYEEGRRLAPTMSYGESRESREPMIYYLRFLEGDSPRVYTLAFFDTAGEDLSSTDTMRGLNINSFISRASGIVFLVDPLQIPYINTRIRMENKPPAGVDVANMLSNIANIIRTNNRLNMKDSIRIPLAVVLTKTDVLMKAPENDEESSILFGLNSSLNIEREKGKYDRTNIEQISAEIEEYMRRAIPNGFVQKVREFREHSYFAVSALGSNPAGSMLTRGISPMRVEDPFIWLLNCESPEEKR